jgi:glycosyltransferase involved in cell wall biosynthesis
MSAAARLERVPVSVVIPAHDEERVIGRCLRALTAGADPAELELVVVCNGCTDATAGAARAAAPHAVVLELAAASKPAALNAGDAVARRFPRFYVDADVELPIESVRATARVLQRGDARCAAPAPQFAVADRSWWIRQFYDTWQRLPYLGAGVVGNGVYALSADGRARFGAFPEITADDQFVLQQFDARERLTVADHRFVVHPPTRVRSLVRIRTRAYRGARELDHSGFARHDAIRGAGRALADLLLRRPRHLAGVAVYVTVGLVAKAGAFLPRRTRWERDDSARLAAR